MRKFLTNRGVNLRVHQRRCTIYTIINTIFVNEEENQRALELAKCILNGTIHSNLSSSIRPSATEDGNGVDKTKEKTRHNVAMRLKDAEHMFSGDLSDC